MIKTKVQFGNIPNWTILSQNPASLDLHIGLPAITLQIILYLHRSGDHFLSVGYKNRKLFFRQRHALIVGQHGKSVRVFVVQLHYGNVIHVVQIHVTLDPIAFAAALFSK